MSKQGQIYKIVNKHNPTTILYIGSTTEDLNIRWQKHLSHSKKHNDTPFYNELYKNGELYEIQNMCFVSFNDKTELLAKETNKIQKYKPLANIIRNYKNLEDTAKTDSDSDTESYLFCREDSRDSIWSTDNETLTTEEKNEKYYTWMCDCNGDVCGCKSENRNYDNWHLEYPEMYNYTYTNKQYIYVDKQLKEVI
jgi:hypothetical protein